MKSIISPPAEVRSWLAGKTQYRVPVKPQYACKTVSFGCIAGQGFGFIFAGHDVVVKPPLGKVGDRVFVKETWWFREEDGLTCYFDGAFKTHPSALFGNKVVPTELEINPTDAAFREWGFVKNQARTMPAWAARIILEIEEIHVERDGDIWVWVYTFRRVEG